MRKRIDITIEDRILKDYKKLCIENENIISHEVEKFMKKELKKYGEKNVKKR